MPFASINKRRAYQRTYYRTYARARWRRWRAANACGVCGEPSTFARCFRHRLSLANRKREKRAMAQIGEKE